MGNWRARIKLPKEIDTLIRDEAIDRQMKLKDFLHSVIDEGLNAIRTSGTQHVFTSEDTLSSYRDIEDHEFVIDEEYRHYVEVLMPVANGSNKKGKILLECIIIGLRSHGVNV